MSSLLSYLKKRETGGGFYRPEPKFTKDREETENLLEFWSSFPSQNKACALSGQSRSTFLMSFSPDRTKVASTHGDHTVRVSSIATGKSLNVLYGHPRTPWCLAFHPSSNDILASGCLGGEVRIWDLMGHGSEVWRSKGDNVITSLTFHPTDFVLVFATGTKLYFWDWSKEEPFVCCQTKNDYEKIRLVQFGSNGHYLYTGIANGTMVQNATPSVSYINNSRLRPIPERSNRRLGSMYDNLLDCYHAHRREMIQNQSNPNTASSSSDTFTFTAENRQPSLLHRSEGSQERTDPSSSLSSMHRSLRDNIRERSMARQQRNRYIEHMRNRIASMTSNSRRLSRSEQETDDSELLPSANNATSDINQNTDAAPSDTHAGNLSRQSNNSTDTHAGNLSRQSNNSTDGDSEYEGSMFVPVPPSNVIRDNTLTSLGAISNNSSSATSVTDRSDSVTSSEHPSTTLGSSREERVENVVRFSNLSNLCDQIPSTRPGRLAEQLHAAHESSHRSNNLSCDHNCRVCRHYSRHFRTTRNTGYIASRSLRNRLRSVYSNPHPEPGELERPPLMDTTTSRFLNSTPMAPNYSYTLSRNTNPRTEFPSVLQPNVQFSSVLSDVERPEQITSTEEQQSHSSETDTQNDSSETVANQNISSATVANQNISSATVANQYISSATVANQNISSATVANQEDGRQCISNEQFLASRSSISSNAHQPSAPSVLRNLRERSIERTQSNDVPASTTGTSVDGNTADSSSRDLPQTFANITARIEREMNELDRRISDLRNTFQESIQQFQRTGNINIVTIPQSTSQTTGSSSVSDSQHGESLLSSHRLESDNPNVQTTDNNVTTVVSNDSNNNLLHRQNPTSIDRGESYVLPLTPRPILPPLGTLMSGEAPLRPVPIVDVQDWSDHDPDMEEDRLDTDDTAPVVQNNTSRLGVVTHDVQSLEGHSWHALQRHHLHPHYSVSILDDTINRPNDALQSAIHRAIAGAFIGRGEPAVANNIINQTYRIQAWDFTKYQIPDLTDATSNIIVPNCKLHNEASWDISQDNSKLATFVPSHRGFPDDNILAVYSLLPGSRGDCIFTKSFGPNAISVSLSPKTNYVMVGLAAKRLSWVITANQLVAQIFKLDVIGGGEKSMKHVSDILHPCDMDIRSHMSVNSAKWLPYPGQGIIYATNKGDLHICTPGTSKEGDKEGSKEHSSTNTSIRRNLLHMLGLSSGSIPLISIGTQTEANRNMSTQTE